MTATKNYMKSTLLALINGKHSDKLASDSNVAHKQQNSTGLPIHRKNKDNKTVSRSSSCNLKHIHDKNKSSRVGNCRRRNSLHEDSDRVSKNTVNTNTDKRSSQLEKRSWSKSSRVVSSGSNQGEERLDKRRVSSQSLQASEKLISCLERLEHLSKRLDDASFCDDIQNKLTTLPFEKTASIKNQNKLSSGNCKSSTFSTIRRKLKMKRRKNDETSSEDSGINPDWDKNRKDSGSCVSSDSTASRNHQSCDQCHHENVYSYEKSIDDCEHSDQENKQSQRSNELGHYDASYRYDHPQVYPSSQAQSIYADPSSCHTYDYDPFISFPHPNEEATNYAGSSASSGVYEDYIERSPIQWIYVPFQSDGSSSPFLHPLGCDPYSPYGYGQEQFYMKGNCDTFGFNQTPEHTDAEFDSQTGHRDFKNFGSFRYRNGERTVVKNGKKKMVRFSKSVKREEEVENSKTNQTSLKKDAEEEEEQNVPEEDLQTIYAYPEHLRTQHTLSDQPIYEFPSGHIEKSCMCFDCILARESSQLQPTENFVF